MKQEIHIYLSKAVNFNVSSTDVDLYTDVILAWWRVNATEIPAWANAARIVFAFTPNSASVERVFALLRNMFDVNQLNSLADQVSAALLLAYNGRRIG